MASVSVSERGGRWSIRWRDAGGRGARSHRLTVNTERRAQALAEEIEQALERFGRYEPRRAGRASALRLLIDEYLVDTVRRRRPNTARRYAQFLELFQRFAGEVFVDEMSFHALSDFSVWLALAANGRHGHQRGQSTIRKHVQAVETMWKWGWQRQARGDYHGVPQPDSLGLEETPPPHKLAPTWDQMDACIGVANGWQRQLYVVLRCTGLRVQQALELRWDDLRLDEARLEIRPELGKSRQERRGRWVPLAPVLVAELAGWGVRDGYLIPCGRLHRTPRARDADRAWDRAGVDKAVWKGHGHHAFRAGFQTGLRKLGADPDAIRHLVGHTRGTVTERYVGPEALPLVATVALVPPVRPGCALPKRRLAIASGEAGE